MIEIYNEPGDFAVSDFDSELECDYGGPADEPMSCRRSGAQALRDGLIGAIQSADPNHVTFYEPSVLSDFGQPETIGIAEQLRFRRVALSFHMYGDPAPLLDQRTRRPDPGKARTLAVPYAWGTAGVPGSESFTDGVFTYSYRVAPAISAPTLIDVPRLAYPHGYRVRVRGATVISAADARLLELRASPRARAVRVTVMLRR